MNLSILIPCYNWNVLQLVKDLHEQCNKHAHINNFEIICIEDGSNILFQNKKIETLDNTKHIILKKNTGRSSVRNLLANTAQHNWLLFIDCDSKIANKLFIKEYIQSMKINTIIYGQTLYEKINLDQNKRLHEKYGKKIESKQKKINFSSHHFLIQKIVFEKIKFDETINSYGYEDVLFQINSNYKFQYISNPLYHTGLKTNSQFITDCKTGLKNLLIHTENKKIVKKIKILKWWKKLTLIHDLIIWIFNMLEKSIITNLNSSKPNLYLLQFYKLAFFTKIKKTSSEKAQ